MYIVWNIYLKVCILTLNIDQFLLSVTVKLTEAIDISMDFKFKPLSDLNVSQTDTNLYKSQIYAMWNKRSPCLAFSSLAL